MFAADDQNIITCAWLYIDISTNLPLLYGFSIYKFLIEYL